MNPRNLVLLFLVGVSATQVVHAHREARGINELLESAKQKLQGLLGKTEDAAGSSVDVVTGYLARLEDMVLDSISKRLKDSFKIDINLNLLSDILKENMAVCGNDLGVKTTAKEVFDEFTSCITDDVSNIHALVKDMKEIWNVAKGLPETMATVSKQCSKHVQQETNVLEEGNKPILAELDDIADDEDDKAIASEAKDLLSAAQHHVSRRDLNFLERAVRCVKSVFSLTKTDLATLPGEIVSAAGNAFKIFKSAKKNIPACVSQKVMANKERISTLGLNVSKCVSNRISESKDTGAAMAQLKAVDSLAKQLMSLKDAKALDAAFNIGKMFG